MKISKYRVVLNYGGEVKEYFLAAYSGGQATFLATRKLEKELNLEKGALKNYFLKNKPNRMAYDLK